MPKVASQRTAPAPPERAEPVGAKAWRVKAPVGRREMNFSALSEQKLWGRVAFSKSGWDGQRWQDPMRQAHPKLGLFGVVPAVPWSRLAVHLH